MRSAFPAAIALLQAQLSISGQLEISNTACCRYNMGCNRSLEVGYPLRQGESRDLAECMYRLDAVLDRHHAGHNILSIRAGTVSNVLDQRYFGMCHESVVICKHYNWTSPEQLLICVCVLPVPQSMLLC